MNVSETERAEQLLDELDQARSTEAENTEDLREVAAGAEAVADAEARLTEAVDIARAHGRSWTRIGIAIGISRQAARQRFSRPARRQ